MVWVVANWKSNKTVAEALEWISIVGPQVSKNDEIKVVVCPSTTAIAEIKKAIQVGGFPILVGSQDLSPFDIGAHTGEEPAALLKQFSDLAILGHSERRKQLGETDELVAEKVSQAISHDIIALVCVQDSQTPVPEGCHLIAYEPIFAIGTGNPDTPQNADKVAKSFKQKYNHGLEVLYGGSITSENVKAFIQQDNIDGVLIGGASLSADEFVKIINTCVSQAT